VVRCSSSSSSRFLTELNCCAEREARSTRTHLVPVKVEKVGVGTCLAFRGSRRGHSRREPACACCVYWWLWFKACLSADDDDDDSFTPVPLRLEAAVD
jgi:hypothetical protein